MSNNDLPCINDDKTCSEGDLVCRINKTKLRQNGKGSNYECPECGQEYKVPIAKMTPEENQKIINRIYGPYIGA